MSADIQHKIASELKLLDEEENKINDDLEHYISNKGPVSPNDLLICLKRIESYNTSFEILSQDSLKLTNQVKNCCELSDRLSTVIRHLDTKSLRVEAVIGCCENFINLRQYKSKIEDAIEAGDLPIAISYLDRLKHIELTPEEKNNEFKFIGVFQRELRKLLDESFRKAINEQDMSAVVRYCPLLRTVDLEAEARDVFVNFAKDTIFNAISADFVVNSIGGNTTDPAAAYAEALSRIFNTTVNIIQKYLPIVIEGLESVHGDIYFLRELHERCQKESAIIMQRYMKYRKTKEFMGPEKNMTSVNSLSVSVTHVSLDELSLLIQYCTSYARYIKTIWLGAESKDRANVEGVPIAQVQVFKGPTKFHNMLDSILHKYYLDGELHLLRSNFKAKLSMLSTAMSKHSENMSNSMTSRGSQSESHSNMEDIHELVSSTMDECFFLTQKCCQRSISTKNVEVSHTVIRAAVELLEKDVYSVFKQYLDLGSSVILGIISDNIARFTGNTNSLGDKSGVGGGGTSASKTVEDLSRSFLQNAFASSLTSSTSNQSQNSSNQADKKRKGSREYGTNSAVDDPWSLGDHVSCFNVTENIGRYITRLREDAVLMVIDVHEFDEEEAQKGGNGRQLASQENRRRSDSSAGSVIQNSPEYMLLNSCRSDFSALHNSFNMLLRSSIVALCAEITQVHVKSVLYYCFDVANTENGGRTQKGLVQLQLSDNAFLSQPAIELLPKLLLFPLAAITTSCTFNMSEANKSLFLDAFTDGCTKQFEYFLYQAKYQYAGALKYDECVRAVTNMIMKCASTATGSLASLKSKYVRLKEILSILTSESPSSNASTAGLRLLSAQDVLRIEALRVDFRF